MGDVDQVSCTHLWELPQVYPSGITDCIFACCPTINNCPAFDFLVKGFFSPSFCHLLPCMYRFCVPFDSVLYSKSKLSRLCLLSYRSRLIAIYKKGFGVLAKLVRLLVVLAVSTLLDKNQTIWFPDTSLLGIWLFSGFSPFCTISSCHVFFILCKYSY